MNYKILRSITIGLQTIMIPAGTFVGFEFGGKHYKGAIIALAAQTALTILQGHIWWLTMEHK